MKHTFFLIIAVAGMTFAGCNSNSKKENITDSAIVDTILPVDSVIVDTTPLTDTALVDSM